jgi:hypothetical protein
MSTARRDNGSSNMVRFLLAYLNLGSHGDKFYIILEGQVSVQVPQTTHLVSLSSTITSEGSTFLTASLNNRQVTAKTVIEMIAKERRQKGQEKEEAVRLMEEEEAQHIMKNEVLRPLVLPANEQTGSVARDPPKGGGDMDELFALAKSRREKQEERVRSPPEGESKPSPKAILLKGLENYFRNSELNGMSLKDEKAQEYRQGTIKRLKEDLGYIDII